MKRNFFIFITFFIARCLFANENIKDSNATQNFKVLIVSGHVENPSLAGKGNVKGTKSFSRIYEYVFNDNISRHFLEQKNQLPNVKYKVILATENIGLKKRVYIANNDYQTDLYIEIHHDSAMKKDIEEAKSEGEKSELWNLIQGFSFHISSKNPNFEKSLLFTKIAGNHFLSQNLIPNHYHLVREKKFDLLDKERGVYNRIKPHGIFVLYNVNAPSIVIECATIVNPYDEKYVLNEDNQKIIVNAINMAIKEYIEEVNKK